MNTDIPARTFTDAEAPADRTIGNGLKTASDTLPKHGQPPTMTTQVPHEQTSRPAPRAITNALPYLSQMLDGLPLKVTAQGIKIHAFAPGDKDKNKKLQQILSGVHNLGTEFQRYINYAYGDIWLRCYDDPAQRDAMTKWAKKRFGDGLNTIWTCARVARHFPPEVRDMNVSWSLYVEMAKSDLGITDKAELLAGCQQKKYTVASLRSEVQARLVASGKEMRQKEVNLLDPEFWPTELRNDLHFIIGRGHLEYLGRTLHKLRVNLEQNTGDENDFGDDLTDENEASEIAKNEAFLDGFQMENSYDVVTKTISESGVFDAPQATLSAERENTEAADAGVPSPMDTENLAENNQEAWEVQAPHPKPLPSLLATEQPKSEKNDNKNLLSYCRNEMPGMIPFAALAEILFSSDGVAYTRHGDKVVLQDPHAKLDESISAAVQWHEAHLLKMIDCREKLGLLADRIAKLRVGDPPKMPRADALDWVSAQIEDLAEMSCRFGGNANGWLDPSDAFNDLQQVLELRRQFEELTAQGNPYPLDQR